MKFLLPTIVKSDDLIQESFHERKPRTATDGPLAFDSRTLEMRNIKAKYKLTTKDIVEDFKENGIRTSAASLQSYLQGNIEGILKKSRRSDELDAVDIMLEQFREMEVRMESKYGRFSKLSMRQIIDGWYKQLGINSGSKIRQLVKILKIDYSTAFLWYQEDRKPRSVKDLVKLQAIVDQAAK
jgi:hypothetical protein